MGGRGSYSSRRKLIGGSASGILIVDGKDSSRLNLAGMNRDIANGVTPEKTLDFLEKTYKKGMTKEQLQVIDEQGWTVLAKQGDRHSVGGQQVFYLDCPRLLDPEEKNCAFRI